MQLIVELTGHTPLLMHNIRLADPDDPITVEIAGITSKKKKTPEDRADIARLEWHGCLYADDDGPYIPTANVRRSFAKAGAIRRLTTAVNRGVIMRTMQTELGYPGPRGIPDLWAREEYRHRAMVGIQGKRTPRTRPIFTEWSLAVEIELLTDALGLDDFTDIVSTAGRCEGLGDNRVNGYGRFATTVIEMAQ
ncbi:hypothetical protein [Frankia sp. Cr1]|uniref:hypothetical protein n=1 Tax=Frankia sp. Cr1 TaxID=3073931 RepID=UPI002AD59093|nr:hypothetical protein [Frankia sp. Cr1]